MFLKREWPETEDFAIKKYLVVKKKYYSIFQEITLAVTLKKNLKMYLHILAFQNIPSIFKFFSTKHFLIRRAPPPLSGHVR